MESFRIFRPAGVAQAADAKSVRKGNPNETPTVFCFCIGDCVGCMRFPCAEPGLGEGSSAHSKGSASRTAHAPLFWCLRQYRLQGRWLQRDPAGTGHKAQLEK